MKTFSTSWKQSAKPKKQRKYRDNSPLHVKNNFLKAHLSDELSKKYEKRTARVRVGDKVTVMVGNFKGKSGSVEEVDAKTSKVFVSGIELQKKDGTKIRRSVSASNIMIIELDLKDKKRQEVLKRK